MITTTSNFKEGPYQVSEVPFMHAYVVIEFALHPDGSLFFFCPVRLNYEPVRFESPAYRSVHENTCGRAGRAGRAWPAMCSFIGNNNSPCRMGSCVPSGWRPPGPSLLVSTEQRKIYTYSYCPPSGR
jgi:hypothetical protein